MLKSEIKFLEETEKIEKIYNKKKLPTNGLPDAIQKPTTPLWHSLSRRMDTAKKGKGS